MTFLLKIGKRQNCLFFEHVSCTTGISRNDRITLENTVCLVHARMLFETRSLEFLLYTRLPQFSHLHNEQCVPCLHLLTPELFFEALFRGIVLNRIAEALPNSRSPLGGFSILSLFQFGFRKETRLALPLAFES